MLYKTPLVRPRCVVAELWRWHLALYPLRGPDIFMNISRRLFAWLDLEIAGCLKPKGYSNLTPDTGSFNSSEWGRNGADRF